MIAWLIETSLAVTLLMVLVLALREPVARSFGAGWAYALWAIPALRLFLPPQLALDLCLPTAVTFVPTAPEMTAPLPAEAGPGQWLPFILALWAGGAVIFLTMQWLSYRAFLSRVRDSARPGRPPVFGGILTWISEAVEGPLALGIFQRRIVLPSDFSRRYDPAERRLALEHELVHHRRGDIWWNIAALFMLALFWFNPVAWMAFRAFRIDQELACDAAVARSASLAERHEYACALVKSASSHGLVAVSALNSARQLKRRLKMMRAHRASPLRSAGGMAAFAAIAVAGLALGGAPARPRVESVRIASAAPAAPVVTTAGVAAPIASPPAPAAVRIVVTGRRRDASAAPLFASASAPYAAAEESSVSLTRLLARLPKVAVGLQRAPAPRVALAYTRRVAVRADADRVFRFETRQGSQTQVYLIREALTPEQAARVKAAITRAADDAKRVEIHVTREAEEAVDVEEADAEEAEAFGGLIEIQTIH